MTTYYTRASRDYDFVPGSGSSLVIANYNAARVLGPSVTFDIKSGFVRQLFRNVNTTHSGSNGADLYTRVGAGWLFGLVLDFPGDVAGGLAVAFAEELVGSQRSVAMQFNVGDPLFWSSRGLPQRSYRATKALLAESELRFDATGTEVVGLNMSGVGNSLLYTYLDDVAQLPQVWF